MTGRLTYVFGSRPNAAARWTRVGRCGLSRALSVGLLLTAAGPTSPAQAQSFFERLQLRVSAAGALMMSKDQRGYLEYSRPGLLTDLQLEYHFNGWFALQLGAAGGAFLSGSETGGLLAPIVGVLGKLDVPGCVPYLALDVGAGFTGKLVRTFARGRLGLDLPVGAGWQFGPTLGLDWVAQRDGPDFSTDAVYGWLGVSVTYRWQRGAAGHDLTARKLEPEPEPEPVTPKPDTVYVDRPPAAPSRELVLLLDQAVRVERSELLAPVLFEFDSVELEPSGLAMLHQVARLLNSERRDIERLQIAAYADARGSDAYNRVLARKRAEHVLEWLVAHGVARERLEASGEGAVDFVESGTSEAEQQQNRRVVFRVLRTGQR